jgi:hypothetical protein
VPLIFEWIAQGGIKEPRERWRGPYLAIAPAGLIVYMGYLWIKFGDPLLFYSSQKYWKREAAAPLDTATRAWATAVEGVNILRDLGLWAHPAAQNFADHLERANSFFNLAFLIFAVVVLLAGVRKLPLSLTIYSLLLIVPPALFGTTGCPAYGYSAIRARRIPSFYRARAPGQKEAPLLRMVDSQRHNVNNPLRAVCELAIRRLNGAADQSCS